MNSTRRQFLQHLALASGTGALLPAHSKAATEESAASFFLVGDTHYCADAEDISKMDAISADYNSRLIGWLNKLPGTEFSEKAGGGTVSVPHGVIHAGDLIDNGDKGPSKAKMVETESAAFIADWGLNGGDGNLRWAVREVHGNHDGPHGETAMVDAIKARNKKRAGLTGVSENGLHYSWDWAGVHFVALGIIVGDTPDVARKRRYGALGSLPFLQRDLADNVGTSGRPVVLIHHVDVARYSETVADDKVLQNEWDYADVQAYYAALKPYRVAAAVCGHTHARNIFHWNGTKDTRAPAGIPLLNTDNAAHFGSPNQAFLHVAVSPVEIRIREFGTKDGWKSGDWTPTTWAFPLVS